MTTASPLALYREAVERQGFAPDEAQQAAAIRLDTCFRSLHDEGISTEGQVISGVYLWGPVGRGKTWLMDGFQRHLQVPSRRLHFHHFMRWVHQRQFQLSGTADPLTALAQEMTSEVRVLCLDELVVSDIADAMLLGRLLQALFEHGLVLVCTSNQAPHQLYADGFNRERFQPAIEAIQRHMEVVELDGGYDHRLHPGRPCQRYWVTEPGRPSPLANVFERLRQAETASTEPIELGHRRIEVERRSESVVWCRYAELCEQPLSAMDFIALVDEFDHILLSEVPRLNDAHALGSIARGTEDSGERVEAGERALPPLSRRDDGVRRFIALVDECYDRRVPLHIEADVAMDELYADGYLAFAFRRTLSRLQEMQLERFGGPPAND